MGDNSTEAPHLSNTDYRFAGALAHRPRRRLRGDMSLMTYSGAHSVVRTLIRARFSPAHSTGQRCACSTQNIWVHFFSILLLLIPFHRHAPEMISVYSQRYIYTGDGGGAVVIYDALTGEVVAKHTCHRSIVRDVSWHPDRPHLVTSSVCCVQCELSLSYICLPETRNATFWSGGTCLCYASFLTQASLLFSPNTLPSR